MASNIDQDIICIGCGYNLHGLDRGGQCPECGMAVAESVRGDNLAHANPKWLADVRSGLTYLYASCLITVAVAAVFFILLFAASLLENADFWFKLLGYVLRGLAILVPILAILGIFRSTAPDPGMSLRESETSMRRVTRTMAVLLPVTIMAQIAFERLLATSSISPNVGNACLTATTILIVAVAMIMILTLFEYLKTLAVRIPNTYLAQTGVNTARTFVVFAVVAALAAESNPPGGIQQLDVLKRLVPLIGGISVLIAFVMGIKLMSMIGSYREAIVECAEDGRRYRGKDLVRDLRARSD